MTDDGEQYKVEAPSKGVELIPDEPLAAKKRSRFTAPSHVLDKVFPRHKSYFGLRRKPFLLVAIGILIMILALVLGLAIGLSQVGRG